LNIVPPIAEAAVEKQVIKDEPIEVKEAIQIKEKQENCYRYSP
ncbi:hypothetical protein T06_5059, partial [Trichinella sp. T6]